MDRENEVGDIIKGEWRTLTNLNLHPIQRTSTNMHGRVAEDMRHTLSTYFIEDGAVPFQWDK